MKTHIAKHTKVTTSVALARQPTIRQGGIRLLIQASSAVPLMQNAKVKELLKTTILPVIIKLHGAIYCCVPTCFSYVWRSSRFELEALQPADPEVHYHLSVRPPA